MKQGEIDVVGVAHDGSVHAMEVAFHEAGLNYVGGVGNRVLKKLLRTLLVLMAYHPADVERHIYFVSPKVHKGAQQPPEDIFDRLESEYPTVSWRLLTNDEFTNGVLNPTLEKAESVADTSELFVRSAKLLELGGWGPSDSGKLPPPLGDNRVRQHSSETLSDNVETAVLANGKQSENQANQLQPLVRDLMKTLLEDFPRLLTEGDIRNLMDPDWCRDELELQLGGLALLRQVEDGKEVSGHSRYWKKVYSDLYYVSNNWWQSHHAHNAASLLIFVERLIARHAGKPGVDALESHRAALQFFR